MQMMNEKDRKKIISEVRNFGGIGLRRQSLRVHKNGAKFPISKSYINDELLDPEITYTLILIPEIKIATRTIVALSYFHRKLGPSVFYTYPKNALNEKEKWRITEVMDQTFKEGFFSHQSSVLSSLNYYFEIHSDWARGNKEMLMISIVLDKIPNPTLEDLIQTDFVDFGLQLKEKKDIYKSLYKKVIDTFPEEDRSDIESISESLRTAIKDFYKKVIIRTQQKRSGG